MCGVCLFLDFGIICKCHTVSVSVNQRGGDGDGRSRGI